MDEIAVIRKEHAELATKVAALETMIAKLNEDYSYGHMQSLFEGLQIRPIDEYLEDLTADQIWQNVFDTTQPAKIAAGLAAHKLKYIVHPTMLPCVVQVYPGCPQYNRAEVVQTQNGAREQTYVEQLVKTLERISNNNSVENFRQINTLRYWNALRIDIGKILHMYNVLMYFLDDFNEITETSAEDIRRFLRAIYHFTKCPGPKK